MKNHQRIGLNARVQRQYFYVADDLQYADTESNALLEQEQRFEVRLRRKGEAGGTEQPHLKNNHSSPLQVDQRYQHAQDGPGVDIASVLQGLERSHKTGNSSHEAESDVRTRAAWLRLSPRPPRHD